MDGSPVPASGAYPGAGPDGPAITERACAKVNLTLRVHGRRADGYHALTSLVAFADIGDRIVFVPGAARAIHVTGPFHHHIQGENLLARTLDLLAASAPGLTLGSVILEKQLPVAAGVGGGSADAAALLRAIRQANPGCAASIDWHGFAARLGADVPVCLENRASWMTGIGENTIPLPHPLPELAAILVNPNAPVPADKTAQVFRQLGASALRPDGRGGTGHAHQPAIATRADLMAVMATTGNDLETAATAVVPAIADVLQALRAVPGLMHARLSGAGPTCVAIAGSPDLARDAVRTIATAHPAWWVRACRLH